MPGSVGQVVATDDPTGRNSLRLRQRHSVKVCRPSHKTGSWNATQANDVRHICGPKSASPVVYHLEACQGRVLRRLQLSSAGSCDVWKHTHKCQTKFESKCAQESLLFPRLRALTSPPGVTVVAVGGLGCCLLNRNPSHLTDLRSPRRPAASMYSLARLHSPRTREAPAPPPGGGAARPPGRGCPPARGVRKERRGRAQSLEACDSHRNAAVYNARKGAPVKF